MVARVLPVIVLDRSIGVIGLLCANTNNALSHLGKVAADSLHTVEVSFTGCCSETGHSHDRGSNVESSDLDCPLKTTDKGLVDLLLFDIEKVRSLEFRVVSLDERRRELLRLLSKDLFEVVDDLLNVLAWCIAQHAFFVSKEIASKMEGNRPRSLELEVVVLLEGFDDLVGVLADD